MRFAALVNDERIRLNNAGRVLYAANLNPDTLHPSGSLSLWLRKVGSGSTLVARTGDSIDGGTLDGIIAWDFNNNGTVGMLGLFHDSLNNGYTALWRGVPGAMSLVVSTATLDWGYHSSVYINQLGDLGIEPNAQWPQSGGGIGDRDQWVIHTASSLSRLIMGEGGDPAPGTTGLFGYACTVTGSGPPRPSNYPSINYGQAAQLTPEDLAGDPGEASGSATGGLGQCSAPVVAPSTGAE